MRVGGLCVLRAQDQHPWSLPSATGFRTMMRRSKRWLRDMHQVPLFK